MCAYGLIIGAMAATVLLLPASGGGDIIALGTLLFLLSDTLLALRLFVANSPARQRLLGLAVWPSYWLGQSLILIGALLYWDFPKG